MKLHARRENPTLGPIEQQDNAERDVLYLLSGQNEGQQFWSVPDLGRAMESDDNAEVAVDALHRAGLLYRSSDDFVFASRAGMRSVAMVGYVV